MRGRSGVCVEGVGRQSDRDKHESISACEGIDRVRIDKRVSDGDGDDDDAEMVEGKEKKEKKGERRDGWWRLGILQSSREGRMWHIIQGLGAGETVSGVDRWNSSMVG